jgi:formamidopyrimidine-DNA glycosylase
MPELPEVETVCRELNKVLPGKKILKVSLGRPNILKEESPAEFSRRLQNRTFQKVSRRGKYLLLRLRKENTLMVHLGMSGRLFWSERPERDDAVKKNRKHIHIRIHLSENMNLFFHDPRMFGRAAVWDQTQVLELDSRLGPEPLAPDFLPLILSKKLSGRKACVKSLLLNQEFIAGIGNIYADEVLFKSGIAPVSPGGLLTQHQIAKLHRSIVDVLQAAILKKGTSISDFLDPRHREGTFQFCLQVYGREGYPCVNCGKEIKKAIISQRGTHWCPHCQS